MSGFRARLRLFECEGHGRYWEAYWHTPEDPTGTHAGTYETPEDVCRAFDGMAAEVYTYDAYEAACRVVMDANPTDWDVSDVVPTPYLATILAPS